MSLASSSKAKVGMRTSPAGRRRATISWQASQARKSPIPSGLDRQARQQAISPATGTSTNPPAIDDPGAVDLDLAVEV